MCQPGSRGLSARSERSVPVREIYGRQQDRFDVRRPALPSLRRIEDGNATRAAIAGVSAPTASNAKKVLAGPVAATPAVPAPAVEMKSSMAVPATEKSPEATRVPREPVRRLVGSIHSRVAAVSTTGAPLSKTVTLPSGAEFTGNDHQKHLVRTFLEIGQRIDAMPNGVEHKNARKGERSRVSHQMASLVGMAYVDEDKRRFARTIITKLSALLPIGTDMTQVLPRFIQEWAEGKGM